MSFALSWAKTNTGADPFPTHGCCNNATFLVANTQLYKGLWPSLHPSTQLQNWNKKRFQCFLGSGTKGRCPVKQRGEFLNVSPFVTIVHPSIHHFVHPSICSFIHAPPHWHKIALPVLNLALQTSNRSARLQINYPQL